MLQTQMQINKAPTRDERLTGRKQELKYVRQRKGQPRDIRQATSGNRPRRNLVENKKMKKEIMSLSLQSYSVTLALSHHLSHHQHPSPILMPLPSPPLPPLHHLPLPPLHNPLQPPPKPPPYTPHHYNDLQVSISFSRSEFES